MVRWPTAWIVFAAAGLCWADGYHNPILQQRSPTEWARGVRRSVGLPLRSIKSRQRPKAASRGQLTVPKPSASSGALRQGGGLGTAVKPKAVEEPAEEAPAQKAKRRHGTLREDEATRATRPAARPAPRGGYMVQSTCNQLVDYLKYLRPDNILKSEFPNFPKKKIPAFREEAKAMLADLGPAAVPHLTQALMTRGGSYGDLKISRRYRSDVEDVIKRIVSACDDSEGDWDRIAAEVAKYLASADASIRKLGEDMQAKLIQSASPQRLLTLMAGDDPLLRDKARDELRARVRRGTFGPSSLLELLWVEDKAVRLAAAEALRKKLSRKLARQVADDHLDALVNRLLLDSDPDVSQAGQKLLRSVFSDCLSAQLLDVIEKRGGWMRAEAMEALLRRAKKRRPKTTAKQRQMLLNILAKGSEQTQAHAVELLNALLTLDDAAWLKEAQQSSVPQVREYAARWAKARPELLGKQTLLDRLDRQSGDDRFVTVRALASKKLTFSEVRKLRARMPLLLQSLEHQDPQIRRAAAVLVGRLGRSGMPAVPSLIRNLRHPDAPVWKAARNALTEIAGEAFGPSDFADHAARLAAVKRWLAWSKAHGNE